MTNFMRTEKKVIEEWWLNNKLEDEPDERNTITIIKWSIYELISKNHQIPEEISFDEWFAEKVTNAESYRNNLTILNNIFIDDKDRYLYIPRLANQCTKDLYKLIEKFPNISSKEMLDIFELELKYMGNLKYIYHYMSNLKVNDIFELEWIIKTSDPENLAYIFEKFPKISVEDLKKLSNILIEWKKIVIRTIFMENRNISIDELVLKEDIILNLSKYNLSEQ